MKVVMDRGISGKLKMKAMHTNCFNADGKQHIGYQVGGMRSFSLEMKDMTTRGAKNMYTF